MRRQFSFEQYRSLDLAMMAGLLCISEFLIVKASAFWFPEQLYTVSAVGAMTAIVLMRWGPWAGIHAALGGLVYVLAARGSTQQLLIYGVGNLLSLLMLLPRRHLGSERIRRDGFLSIGFGLGTLLLMQLGRALTALLLGKAFRSCLGFFTTDALSLLFTGLIVWIARRLDGIYEDQRHYLLRIHKSEEKGGF